MKFIIKEKEELLSCSIMPLAEGYDMEYGCRYADRLSTVMVNGVLEYATEIGSGIYIETIGDLIRGEDGITEMKQMSKVFRKALNLAIEKGDKHSAYFRAILNDYAMNGICLPFLDPFYE